MSLLFYVFILYCKDRSIVACGKWQFCRITYQFFPIWLFIGKRNLYKQLKAVSRQPLTNFVNLKSNTIMKKPQCKDTCVKTVCQAFYRQYMLSPEELCNKKCYKGQNFTQWYQILLKLTFQFLFLKEKDALSGAYNRHCLPANKLRFSNGPDNFLFRITPLVKSVRY